MNPTKQFDFIHKENSVLDSINKDNPEQESDIG